MSSKFQHSKENPFHISVGALVTNEKGEIYVHHAFKEKTQEKYRPFFGSNTEMFYLMRETLENDETLEQAVTRGVFEEFGVTQSEIIRYLGSIQVVNKVSAEEIFEKTTIYFHVAAKEIGERPANDFEGHTTLEWHSGEELLTLYEIQKNGGSLADIDESKIVKAYLAGRK